MRESNVSSVTSNKPITSITSILYDRRALDCTSTLPLINSLTNLAHLISDSPRIRETIAVDGGLERLVSILQTPRTEDVLSLWKWSLAFQCVIQIGIHGSEQARLRIVEADMVSVIASILCRFLRTLDHLKAERDAAKAEREARRIAAAAAAQAAQEALRASEEAGIASGEGSQVVGGGQSAFPGAPGFGLVVVQQQAQDIADTRRGSTINAAATLTQQVEGLGLNIETLPRAEPRLPSEPTRAEIAALVDEVGARVVAQLDAQAQAAAAPTSAPVQAQAGPSTPLRRLRGLTRSLRRTVHSNENTPNDSPASTSRPSTPPSALARGGLVRRTTDSNSDDNSDASGIASTALATPNATDSATSTETVTTAARRASVADLSSSPGAAGAEVVGEPLSVSAQNSPTVLTAPVEAQEDAERARRVRRDLFGAPAAGITATETAADRDVDVEMEMEMVEATPLRERTRRDGLIPGLQGMHTGVDAFAMSMPREQDIVQCLQLLAYITKYPYLRSYFSNTQLIPHIALSPTADPTITSTINVFALVERFTLRIHPREFQSWAGVIMRNSCKKDDSRGGRRQCANLFCGKWEDEPRQFAKCRRCRRSKYCSKACQSAAWAGHRWWCHERTPTGEGSGSRRESSAAVESEQQAQAQPQQAQA
ncbi:hypothetical protein YB2330_000556 [Saitoella coloradoensis]